MSAAIAAQETACHTSDICTASDEDEPCNSCSSRLSSEPNSPRDAPLKVCLLSSNASMPTRATQNAAGFDLFAAESCMVPAWKRALIATDISVELPAGCYGRIAPRSGLAKKNSIDVAGGVVDPDYRGPVGVILVNSSDTDFIVNKGDRVAQFILERYVECDAQLVQQLSETSRGSGGFGSTGK